MKNKINPEMAHKEIPENSALIDYINNTMKDPHKREFEEWISDDRMLGDAIEGLKQIGDAEDIKQINDSISIMIDKKISQKKKKKLQPIQFPLWVTLLVTITLFAVIVGYTLIRMMNH